MEQPSIINRSLVSVFSTSTLEGTSAAVYELEQCLSCQQLQEIARKEGVPATCFYSKSAGQHYAVRFFSPHNEIQLCGHGLLATAKVIARKGDSSFLLSAKGQQVKAEHDPESGRVWLAFDELSSTVTSSPVWVESVFNPSPELVSIAGGEDGYFIMQWPDGFNLKELRFNATKFIQHTKKAVIVTCKSILPEYDYCFRYFAPQYGVVEDKATGSAHRVLVSYWNQRLNKCNVKALQLSNGGAELIGRYGGGKVWISGAVSILE